MWLLLKWNHFHSNFSSHSLHHLFRSDYQTQLASIQIIFIIIPCKLPHPPLLIPPLLFVSSFVDWSGEKRLSLNKKNGNCSSCLILTFIWSLHSKKARGRRTTRASITVLNSLFSFLIIILFFFPSYLMLATFSDHDMALHTPLCSFIQRLAEQCVAHSFFPSFLSKSIIFKEGMTVLITW